MTPKSSSYQQAIDFALKAREAGDAGLARKWAGIAAKLEPDQEVPWLILASMASGRASLEYYRQALKVNPQSRIARLGIRKAEKISDLNPPPLHTKRLSGRYVQAAKPENAIRKQAPILVWLSSLSILALFAVVVWASFSSMRNIVASAHLLPSATSPLRLAVRGNQLTPTPTFTPTPTPTFTPTPTPTFTPTPKPTNTPVPTTIASNPPVFGNLSSKPSQISKNEFWIEVNLTTQQLIAHRGNDTLKTFTVSTGTWATPTVVGQYQVYVKLYSTTMTGPGYYLPDVPYTMYFYKGYGIHGTYWHNNFGNPMSHGCINMRTSEAGWVFDNSNVGTWVIIHY